MPGSSETSQAEVSIVERKHSSIDDLPIELLSAILNYIPANYAFVLLPRSGAIRRIIDDPSVSPEQKIKALTFIGVSAGRPLWFTLSALHIPYLVKFCVAARYASSVGYIPTADEIDDYMRHSRMTSKSDERCAKMIVDRYFPAQSTTTSSVKKEAPTEDEIEDMIQQFSCLIDRAQGAELATLKDLVMENMPYISQEKQSAIIQIIEPLLTGYQFNHHLLEMLVAPIFNVTPHKKTKDLIVSIMARAVNQQQTHDAYYINNVVRQLKTCQLLPYLNYQHAMGFDVTFTFLHWSHLFSYADMAQYLSTQTNASCLDMLHRISQHPLQTKHFILFPLLYLRIMLIPDGDYGFIKKEQLSNIFQTILLTIDTMPYDADHSGLGHAFRDLTIAIDETMQHQLVNALLARIQKNEEEPNPYRSSQSILFGGIFEYTIQHLIRLNQKQLYQALNSPTARQKFSKFKDVWSPASKEGDCEMSPLECNVFATVVGKQIPLATHLKTERRDQLVVVERTLKDLLFKLREQAQPLSNISAKSILIQDIKTQFELLVQLSCKNTQAVTSFFLKNRLNSSQALRLRGHLLGIDGIALRQVVELIYHVPPLTKQEDVYNLFNSILNGSVPPCDKTWIDGSRGEFSLS